MAMLSWRVLDTLGSRAKLEEVRHQGKVSGNVSLDCPYTPAPFLFSSRISGLSELLPFVVCSFCHKRLPKCMAPIGHLLSQNESFFYVVSLRYLIIV